MTELLLVLAILSSFAAPAQAQRRADPPPPAALVLELPSLRVVSQTRPDVLATPVAPGSIMKAFTLAAALESGIASADTRILCRRTVDLDGKAVTCVHPDYHRALDPVEALSKSCNVYFATLARRLPRQALDDVLVRAGLSPSDAAVPMPRVALGIEGVRATPRQWLEGFLRLTGSAGAPLSLRPETRRVLRLALESTVRSGTAVALWNAGYSGLAKTGTAPMPGGGAMGLVVAVVPDERPTHAVVIVAPGVNGATAAGMASEALVRAGVPHVSRGGERPEIVAGTEGSPLRVGRLGRSGAYEPATMPVGDYVAQAVAGEGGDGLPPAALDALAITARTFAERNRGRHASEGFDLCDLTHCLSLRPATAAARGAASRTSGRVIRVDGRPAEVYLSASCGGHTEMPSAVWRGAVDPPHLPAAPDEVCRRTAPWRSDVSIAQLQRALEGAGARGALTNLRVTATTSSGRVAMLAVDGMVPPTIDGNSFRTAISRVLEWGVVKSTWFTLERTGNGFRFVGRGRGHGVGLCVEGAAARASAGADGTSILAHYFPGTTLSGTATDVRVRLPESEREHTGAFRAMVERELGLLAAKLALDLPQSIDIVVHPTVESFGRASGLPWWAAARTRGTQIDLVPLTGLRTRGIVDTTVRHELVHVLVGERLADRPLWVREGLAMVMAGEVEGAGGGNAPCPTDADLRGATSRERWQAAYQAAGRCVARALSGGKAWRDLR